MLPTFPWVAAPRAALLALLLVGLCACGSSAPVAPARPAGASPRGHGATVPPTDPPAPARVTPAPVTVTLDLAHPGPPVPARFVGLSFEASTLSHFARFGGHGDLAMLLRSLGPGLIRFGGISADTDAAWVDPLSPRPAWAGWTVTAPMLSGVAAFARRSGWRVLLTVGLAHYDPEAAAREVAAAHFALGQNLAAVEIGNEPDSYATHGLRSPPWGVTQYLAEVAAYRQAIARITPGVSIVGPDVSGSRAFERWGTPFAAAAHPALLTGHHYPLGCHDAAPPSIARLLSPALRRAEGAALDRYESLAAAAGVPFRLDETGSVSCGGRPGVSDTFASALWALDISVRAMTTGIVGINFEGNVLHCNTYTPICARTAARLQSGVLSPQPEWYALLLLRYLVGDRPLRVHVTPAAPGLDVAALLAPGGGAHLVVVNDASAGTGATELRVSVGRRFASARVLALTAPSAGARSGVMLGGAVVRGDGTWAAPRRLPVHRARGGVILVTVPAESAALVTLAPGGARVGRRARVGAVAGAGRGRRAVGRHARRGGRTAGRHARRRGRTVGRHARRRGRTVGRHARRGGRTVGRHARRGGATVGRHARRGGATVGRHARRGGAAAGRHARRPAVRRGRQRSARRAGHRFARRARGG